MFTSAMTMHRVFLCVFIASPNDIKINFSSIDVISAKKCSIIKGYLKVNGIASAIDGNASSKKNVRKCGCTALSRF